ncbi:MAG: FkbM family methyltransferase [Candidatus Competibacteraceae bacterium]|nr:FkbM family methyltransferase [Candidatus Competibacteraceae bacterium]
MSLWLCFAHRLGLLRSVLMYHGIPFRRRRLTRFYAQFIQPDDLCFDIGAHVGSRLRAWMPLGARMVALEPQPECMRLLRRWHHSDPRITLLEQAVGAISGTAELFISPRTPTVTSLSLNWITMMQSQRGFEQVRWEYAVPVPVTTLDQLITAHGLPAFCKIDVEGYELEVLKGLTQPIPALSFEYLPACLDTARACVAHLMGLGRYEFNASPGESHRLRSNVWLDADALLAWLDTLTEADGSGDIYARLRTP